MKGQNVEKLEVNLFSSRFFFLYLIHLVETTTAIFYEFDILNGGQVAHCSNAYLFHSMANYAKASKSK